jgi:type III secretory pathway component EscV
MIKKFEIFDCFLMNKKKIKIKFSIIPSFYFVEFPCRSIISIVSYFLFYKKKKKKNYEKEEEEKDEKTNYESQ